MGGAVMTAVAIVHQRPRFRALVAALLEAEGFTVEAPEDVVDWSAQPGRIAIIDVTDPDGLNVLGRVRQGSAGVPVLALVDGRTVQDYANALQQGATNAVSMRARPNDIVDAVHAALAGRAAPPPTGGHGTDPADV